MFKKYLCLILFLAMGCPKVNNEISAVEKERQEALNELMSKEDEEFEDIPEASDKEKKDDQ